MSGTSAVGDAAQLAALELLAYCRERDWAGYDPYDALNSRVFQTLRFLHFRWARLALTQGVKRCPVNLRPLLLVPRTPNPKGVALFLDAAVKLSRSVAHEAAALVRPLAEKLMALRTPGWPRSCWGYNFDWQQRYVLVPKGSPNIICTTFAGHALLDAAGMFEEPEWVEAAVGAADFILGDLVSKTDDGSTCFRYTLHGRDEVHNANLLGAAYLCRVARVSGRTEYLGPALEAARFSAGRQREDGAWTYGEAPAQGWVDNFHTGYNLVALNRIGKFAGTAEFAPALRKGLAFFKTRFIREDGAPKYYDSAVHPIDIHSAAQSVITLAELAEFGRDHFRLARTVLGWTLENMRSPKGFFYYQKRPHYTIRTSFMRWSQAWMLLALAIYLAWRADRT